MSGKPDPADLRAKLDQGRANFITTDLSLCFTFVDLAATRLKMGNRKIAEQAITSAEKGYTTMSRLLSDPKHASHLTADQVQEFTEKLKRLRERLDRLRG